jgi:protein bicaudal D
MAKVSLLAAHVDSLHHLRRQIETEDQLKATDQKAINEKLNEIVHQYTSWFTLSAKEIDTLKLDIAELQKSINCSDAMTVLRNEITNLKNKLLSSEQKTLDLHADVKTLSTLSQNAGQSLNSARGTLVMLSDDLAQLYHLVCTVNGDTPSRVLLDHKTEDLSLDNDSLSAIQSQLKSDILIQQPNVFEDLQGLGDAIEVKRYVDTIKDQIKYLKTAVEHAIELNKDKIPGNLNGEEKLSVVCGMLHLFSTMFQLPTKNRARKLQIYTSRSLSSSRCCQRNASRSRRSELYSNQTRTQLKSHLTISSRSTRTRKWS